MISLRARPPVMVGGFTLLEVMVAIVVGGLVILATRLLSERIAESGRALARATREESRHAAADELLRALVGQMETQPDLVSENPVFVGNGQAAEFTTWCERPEEWEERCRVRLELDSSASGPVLRAKAAEIGAVDLDSFNEPAALRYLLDAGNGGRWIVRWNPAPYAPVAIGIVTATDTVILRVGPRG